MRNIIVFKEQIISRSPLFEKILRIFRKYFCIAGQLQLPSNGAMWISVSYMNMKFKNIGLRISVANTGVKEILQTPKDINWLPNGLFIAKTDRTGIDNQRIYHLYCQIASIPFLLNRSLGRNIWTSGQNRCFLHKNTSFHSIHHFHSAPKYFSEMWILGKWVILFQNMM